MRPCLLSLFALLAFPAAVLAQTPPVATEPPVQTATPALTLPPLKFSGDFRFRTEHIRDEQPAPAATAERNRQRIRLRAGVAAQVNPDTEVVARLATGSTLPADSNTTNQDLTGYYAKKSVVLDLAYFNWRALNAGSDETALYQMNIWGGKTPLPFQFAGGNDLIFDSDLTPEGLALRYRYAHAAHECYLNLSATWLEERFSAPGAADNTDVSLAAVQSGYQFKGQSFSALLMLSYYSFSNVKGATAPAARGNTLLGGAYANDFKLASAGLELGTPVLERPAVLYGEAVQNSDGGAYKNAFIVGLKYGKLQTPGSWSVAVDHREAEKDAVLGVLTDSDSSGGGADIRSLRMAAAYQVGTGANIGLTYFNGVRAISAAAMSYQRAMLDFNFAF